MSAVLRLLGFVLRRTFVDPVREGHLRDRGWPPGLRAIVVVGLGLYVAMVVAAVASEVLRRQGRLLFSPPDQTLPALAVPLIVTAMIMALACLFTAGLHLTVPLRVAITVVIVGVLLYPVEWGELKTIDLVIIGLAAVLPVVVALRWRRGYHWGEFVASLVVIGHAVVLHQSLGLVSLTSITPGIQLSELTRLTEPLWALATPVSVLAGAALVEITTSAATWTVTGIWAQVSGRRRIWPWTVGALGALIVGRIAQEAVRISSRSEPVPPSQLLLGAALAATVLGACTLATWLADRVPTGDPGLRPDPDDLLSTWSRCAPFLALLLSVGLCLQVLLTFVLRGFGIDVVARLIYSVDAGPVTFVTSIVGSLAAITAALLLSWRGWRKAGLLIMAFGTMYGAATTFEELRLVTTTEDMLVAVSLAAVVLLVWLAARRRLTLESQLAIAGVLLLTVAYQYRDAITEPLTALVSLTGVSAALLVGLLWRILTDNGYTRGDSPAFPQPSRVLLAVANAIVGVTFAAQVALLGGKSDLDLSQTERVGDTFLGFPLVMAVLFAGLALAARGRDVRTRSSARTAAPAERS